MRRALVSVSDKRGLDVLSQILIDAQVEVLSTGGTYKALRGHGVEVVKVSEYTGAPEILDGRVKTLHPKIHGGILALPTPEHDAELRLHGIAAIDLVVVNLYPFREVIRRPGCTFDDAVENIDIGGPSMVRAAAKNWQRVAVIVDPEDYALLGEALRDNGNRLPEALRRRLARKAFAHTATYDAAIATYLQGYDDAGEAITSAAIGERIFVVGEAAGELRYGENPHQEAAVMKVAGADEPASLAGARQHQGKPLSYNNLLDADGAVSLIRDLAPLGTAAAVIKHVSPCGAALTPGDAPLVEVYARARACDPESAFGGIVALSREVDEATAQELVSTFLEVVIAPAYSAAALAILASKKNLRVLEMGDLLAPPPAIAPLRLRSISGGLLVQRDDQIAVSAAAAKVVSQRAPSADELVDLEIALRVGKAVRSNAIVIARGGASVGIGGGQTSRVEAVRQATTRAGERAKGAVMASDAFFPFRDSIDRAAEAGITAIIQPGGSIRDAESIAAADEHGIAMVFTGERHFRH
ncbi:MAG: bifunctional phosphoribosylaminoimidazolecarboxamide formyltransferase/IMP cyclohydrolase [Myxococcales bacterium]|nr:bifunctional phosphoribosylaminoimidazolecarboxamide formyltransferase/IMP cyclohydrolase [Myxococcales bacterium]